MTVSETTAQARPRVSPQVGMLLGQRLRLMATAPVVVLAMALPAVACGYCTQTRVVTVVSPSGRGMLKSMDDAVRLGARAEEIHVRDESYRVLERSARFCAVVADATTQVTEFESPQGDQGSSQGESFEWLSR